MKEFFPWLLAIFVGIVTVSLIVDKKRAILKRKEERDFCNHLNAICERQQVEKLKNMD